MIEIHIKLRIRQNHIILSTNYFVLNILKQHFSTSVLFFLIDDIPHSIYYIPVTNFLYYFIYFWLRWVLIVEQVFSSCGEWGATLWLWCTGFSLWCFLLLWSTGSKAQHGLQ